MIESQVTKPLEDSIAGIDAVDVITSISRAEQSQISVRFRLEKDADAAAAEVRDRTSRVRNKLPQAIDEPVIAKVEADAFPVIWLAFTSDTLTPLQINDLVNRIVKSRLQTVTGVADVRIYGERKYAMRVWLDPDKLAGYRLTTQDVEDAIRRSNLELPAGRIESQQREFSVTSQTDLVRPAQFGEIVIKNVNGFPVKIRDVARVEEGAADERSSVRLNGRQAISAGVIRQATANPLTLVAGRARHDPQAQGRPAAGHHRSTSPTTTRCSSTARSRTSTRPSREADPAGGAGDLRVPAHLARLDHPDRHHSGQPDRRLRADGAVRLHHQHPDAAGAGAGDRPGGGRRHRDAGEHLPPHRGGHGPVLGRRSGARAKSASPWSR